MRRVTWFLLIAAVNCDERHITQNLPFPPFLSERSCGTESSHTDSDLSHLPGGRPVPLSARCPPRPPSDQPLGPRDSNSPGASHRPAPGSAPLRPARLAERQALALGPGCSGGWSVSLREAERGPLCGRVACVRPLAHGWTRTRPVSTFGLLRATLLRTWACGSRSRPGLRLSTGCPQQRGHRAGP